jgi:hypothetical protein
MVPVLPAEHRWVASEYAKPHRLLSDPAEENEEVDYQQKKTKRSYMTGAQEYLQQRQNRKEGKKRKERKQTNKRYCQFKVTNKNNICYDQPIAKYKCSQ